MDLVVLEIFSLLIKEFAFFSRAVSVRVHLLIKFQ